MPTTPSIASPSPDQRLRASRPPAARTLIVGAVVAVVAVVGCYEDPQARMDQAQQVTDMVDVVNELTARTSELSFTLDSLRNVVVKQDSTIWRLANLAGVPYQR